ncbi:MAG TPA: peptidylprolyl isomerase [Bryobacteraceae bacterium]|nr:peptidylprolyl isomerase [Bryobacteraceae bacterium]
MTFTRSLLFVCPAVCLLAQTPPQNPPPSMTPVPKPSVTLTPQPPAAPAKAPPDRVVLTVGDIKITAEQFDQIVDTLGEQVRAMARGPRRKEFADNIVNILALAQEGKREKLDSNPAYQEQAMFASASVLAQTTYAEMSKNLKMDDAAVHEYYDQHKAEFEQIHARHILIRVKDSPMPLAAGKKELTDEEALAKAKEIHQKLVDGANFEELAKTESDDAQSAVKGGDLGFFGHGKMVPPFEQAAFALKPGQLSDPVKTPFGYHLIKVEAVRSFDEIKPEVERRAKAQQVQNSLKELVKKSNAVYDPEFFGMAAK